MDEIPAIPLFWAKQPAEMKSNKNNIIAVRTIVPNLFIVNLFLNRRYFY